MRSLILFALLALGLSSACAAADPEDGSPQEVTAEDGSAEAPPAAASPQPATAGAQPQADDADIEIPETLAFTARTVAGTAFEGGAYAGQDLMLWFWAPW